MVQVRNTRWEAGASAVLRYVGLAIMTMVAGLVLRLAPLGWPYWITKWGGSVLWAMMVYWLVAMVNPFRRVLTTALLAGSFAALVESVRLYHTPGLDAFRRTLAGVLLLGSTFSAWHMVAYWVAIALAAGFDRWLLRRRVA